MIERAVAACDGASKGNPGSAGWGWVLLAADGSSGRWESGPLGRATNNVAELTGLERLLEAVDPAVELEVRLDSEYVRKCFDEWLPGWIRKGWKNSKGQPVANREIIERIITLRDGRKVEFVHVAAHQVDGDPLNALADSAADEAARTQQADGGTLGREQASQMLRAGRGGNAAGGGRPGAGGGGAGAAAKPARGSGQKSNGAASRVIDARYSGTCFCGKRYESGAPIARGPKGWGHPECAASAAGA